MTKEKHTPDNLARLLFVKMHENCDSAKALAEKLGISQGHLSQLFSGEKSLLRAQEKLVRQISAYIGIPAVLAFLWAGKLSGKDFFHDPMSFGERLQAGLRVVSQSQYAGESGVSIEDLLALNEQVQLLLLHLFEQAEGKPLIEGRVDTRQLLVGDRAITPFEVRRNVTS